MGYLPVCARPAESRSPIAGRFRSLDLRSFPPSRPGSALLRAGILAVFVVCSGGSGCGPSDTSSAGSETVSARELQDWGLPSDLPEHLRQLETLELSGKIDRVDWLEEGLTQVALRATSVSHLDGLPSSLQNLYACNSPIEELGELPDGLRHLDLRYTNVSVVGDDLPEGLRFLAVGGLNLEEVRNLPASLVRLEISDAPNAVRSYDGLALSGSLVAFAWMGAEKQTLPPALLSLDELDRLVVQGTSIEEIDRLPTVFELVLLNNRGLQRFALPADLESLTLDELRNPVLLDTIPPSLERLTLKRATLGTARSWPDSIRELNLYSTQIRWESVPPLLSALAIEDTPFPSKLPGSLTHLTVGGMESLPSDRLEQVIREVHAVADSLESLSVDWPQQETDFAKFSRLHSLEIPSAGLGNNTSLPDNLTSLTVHGRIEAIPNLPRLTTLDLTECTNVKNADLSNLQELAHLETLILRDTDVQAVPALPDSLRTLDLSGTDVIALAGLPPNLHRLILHVGQVTELGEAVPASLRELVFVPSGGEAPCPDLALAIEPD